MAEAASKAGQSLQEADPRLRAWAEANGHGAKSVKEVEAALKKQKGELGDLAKNMVAGTEEQLTAWQKLKTSVGTAVEGKVTLDASQFEGEAGAAMREALELAGLIEPGMHGDVTLDGSQLEAAADNYIKLLSELLSMISEGGGSTGRGGGGGSKKKDAGADAARAAEEARRAQEAAWQRELDDQLKYLERKKRMREIDTQQEIKELERIAATYARTTEQKIAMEDKLFEARARLRDEEIAHIDKLNQGVITALRNRYEEQRKIEDEQLRNAADGWRKWADESVQAIQRQIDALDALTKSEDREAQEAAKRRKIEATRQMLEYTTDDANRERLQKELQRLEEDLAKWQRSNAIADEKDRLRSEQEAIRERAQAEQEAIAKQQDELSALYDERLKDAALRAEAERMLTQSSQEDILKLIGDFAPDYEATGKTLGERLFSGLTSMLGPLTDWFRGINDQITAVQDRAAQAALNAADAFYAGSQNSQNVSAPPPINVENNFYVPVESPADTQRKIQQANEDLAALLV